LQLACSKKQKKKTFAERRTRIPSIMRVEVVIFLAAMLSPVARALPSGSIPAQVPSRCDDVIFCNSISRLRGGQWRQVAGFFPCLKKTKRIIEVKPPPAPSFHQVYVQVIEVVTLLFPLWLTLAFIVALSSPHTFDWLSTEVFRVFGIQYLEIDPFSLAMGIGKPPQ
jgi:hypothetical protein